MVVSSSGRRTRIPFAPSLCGRGGDRRLLGRPHRPEPLPRRILTEPPARLGRGTSGRPSRFAGMLRYLTAGESHGRALVVIVEGMPAGLLVTAEDIQRGLARRRLGFGRGPRMRFEADEVSLVGGVRHGRTLGSPVAIEIANTEWPKWEERDVARPRACPPRS